MQVTIHWGEKPDIDGPRLLGLDVEGRRENVRLVQFGAEQDAYLFDMGDPAQRQAAIQVLKDERVEWVTHSAYDGHTVWESLGIDLTGRIRDTFLLACLTYPGGHNPHGLKPLSTRLIDSRLEEVEAELHAIFKATYGGKKDDYLERGYNELDVHHPVYALYSALDAVYCLKLYHELKKVGRVTGKVFFQQQEESDILNFGASRRGMKVDRERTQALLSEAEANIRQANESMQELIGCPAGSIKVGKWLEEQGVEIKERTDSGGPKIDKHTLQGLLAKYGDEPVVGDVLRARALRSGSSNRKANLANFLKFSEFDGAVHPDFKTAIAATGRMSITDPAMQTLSKDEGDTGLRGCFVARPGHVFIGADFDSQEMRLAAALSGDKKLAELVLSGADLHALAAEAIVGPGWTKKDRNTVGKVANFACMYGVGGFGFSKQTGLDVWAEVVSYGKVEKVYDDPDQARAHADSIGGYVRYAGPAADAVRAWWAQYPDLDAWNQQNKQITKDHGWPDGCIELDSGRRIPVDYAHAVTNYKVQGTGRDIAGTAIRLYDQMMPNTLSLVIHDELLAEVPEDKVEEGLAALNQAMNFTFRSKVEPNSIPVPITATAETLGVRWRKI